MSKFLFAPALALVLLQAEVRHCGAAEMPAEYWLKHLNTRVMGRIKSQSEACIQKCQKEEEAFKEQWGHYPVYHGTNAADLIRIKLEKLSQQPKETFTWDELCQKIRPAVLGGGASTSALIDSDLWALRPSAIVEKAVYNNFLEGQGPDLPTWYTTETKFFHTPTKSKPSFSEKCYMLLFSVALLLVVAFGTGMFRLHDLSR